jgi:hypothetical protein
MTLGPKPIAVFALSLLLSGCGGGDRAETSCRPDGERPPQGPAVTIAEVLESKPSEPVLARGAFLYRAGDRPRLCSTLAESYPPQCGEPSLVVEGLGNPLRTIEGLETTGQRGLQSTSPRVSWSESTTIGGRLDGRVLRIEPSCSSARVIDLFRQETNQRPALDLFLSNSEVEHVDFEALENQSVVARRRREWGRFSVAVFVRHRGRVLQQAFEQVSNAVGDAQRVRPDDRGIVWARDGDKWIALKEYGENFVLEWLAGRRKAVDVRWERLDVILSEL